MKKLILMVLFFSGGMAHAQVHNYACHSLPGEGAGTDQLLQIDGEQITVAGDHSDVNAMNFTATFDMSYRGKNPDKIRYTGKEDGNRRAVIAYTGMLQGSRVAYINIQGSEDGFWANNYKCVLKGK